MMPIFVHAQSFDSKNIKIEVNSKPVTKKTPDSESSPSLSEALRRRIDPKLIEKVKKTNSTSNESPNEQLIKPSEPQKIRNQLEASGGDVSGGGTTIPSTSGRRLLDVYSFPDSSGPGIRDENLPNEKLVRLDLYNSVLSDRLLKAIGRVRMASPSLALALSQVSQRFPIYLVKGRFQILSPSFDLSQGLQGISESDLSTTALYVKDIGVLISRDEFIEMSSFQQSALIVHELVRMLQIQFQISLSHLELQNAVASILDIRSDLDVRLRESALRSFLISEELLPQIENVQKVEDELVQRYGVQFRVGLNEVKAPVKRDLADVADLMTELSIKIYLYRAFNSLSVVEARYLRDQEVVLDSNANQLRGMALEGVVSGSIGHVTGLVESIHHSPAEKKILQCANKRVFVSSECRRIQSLFNAFIQ